MILLTELATCQWHWRPRAQGSKTHINNVLPVADVNERYLMCSSARFHAEVNASKHDLYFKAKILQRVAKQSIKFKTVAATTTIDDLVLDVR